MAAELGAATAQSPGQRGRPARSFFCEAVT